MITIYLLGCLASFIFILAIRGFNCNEITLQDVVIIPLYILSSWIFILSILFFQFYIWIGSVTEELDAKIIWKKKK